MIARRVPKVLPNSEVKFGGHDRGVAQGQLNLFQRRMALVSEMGIRATRVMGRDENSSLIGVRLQDIEDGLLGQPVRANPAPFVEAPKYATSPQAYCIGPPPDRGVHPVGNRNSANAAVFAD